MSGARENKKDIHRVRKGDFNNIGNEQEDVDDKGKRKRMKKSTDAQEIASVKDGTAGNQNVDESSESDLSVLKNQKEGQIKSNQSGYLQVQTPSQNQAIIAQPRHIINNNHHHYYLSTPNHAPQSHMQASDQFDCSNINIFFESHAIFAGKSIKCYCKHAAKYVILPWIVTAYVYSLILYFITFYP